MTAGLRLAWLGVASVLLAVALGVALNANADGASRFSATTVVIYAAFVAALGLGTYALHRRAPRTPPAAAPARALIDTLLAAGIGGPLLFGLLAGTSLIVDCFTGTGC